MVVVRSLLLWWSQWRLGVQWGETQEEESFHQVGAVLTVLSNTKHNTIAVQLLFGEFQKRKERLFACFVRQRLRESHIQDVVVVVQDLILDKCEKKFLRKNPVYTHRVPAWWDLIRNVKFDGDASRRLLCNNLRNETVFVVALTFSVVVLWSLLYIVFNLFVDERQMISSFRKVDIGRRLRNGVERCLARVINYEWWLIVIGSVFSNYIRSTTAALHPEWRSKTTTSPTNCWM